MAKQTPFYQQHLKQGAKIIEFAGYLMPVQYQGIVEEHRKVRSSVGIFDLSHMGEFLVKGKGAEAFLQKLAVNDVNKLQTFQVQYSCMCYPEGGIVDDILIYRLPEHWMLVVNAANLDKDFAWVQQSKFGEVEIENLSDQMGLLAIQGPQAQKVMAKLTSYDLDKLKFYWGTYTDLDGNRILFSRTGYTGEDGFELYLSPDSAERLWNKAMAAGQEFGVEPVGLGARDSLRLEMKYMLYGNDIDQTTNPLEAGLGWIVKFDKGDFIGREAILKAKAAGLKRKLVAFEMQERCVPRQHYAILKEGNRIGEVTSGLFSPSLEKGIGLGYVQIEYSEPGSRFEVQIRERLFPAQVVKPPFWKNSTHK
jgi:aminomethyltransferase